MAEPWKQRIVGYADVPPSDLQPNDRNWRTHPFRQRQVLGHVLDDIGIVQNVIVNKRTGKTIDGHLRIELAIETGQPTVPVTYVDLTEDEEATILATFDPVSAMAEVDRNVMQRLMGEVKTDRESVRALMAEIVFKSNQDGTIPPDAFDVNAEWQGMPEFGNDDQTAMKQIIVSFASVEDMEQFSRIVEQKITMETRSVWYPARHLESIRDKAYVANDD